MNKYIWLNEHDKKQIIKPTPEPAKRPPPLPPSSYGTMNDPDSMEKQFAFFLIFIGVALAAILWISFYFNV